MTPPTAPAPAAQTVKTCTNCPSFLAGRKQSGTIGADILAPICGLKMIPLVMPNQPSDVQQRVLRDKAHSCAQFGVSVNLTPLASEHSLFLEAAMDGDAMSKLVAEPAIETEQVNARCTTCMFYVPSANVQSETGWVASLCRAKGALMPDDRLERNARVCGSYKRTYGPRRTTNLLSTVVFMPEFSKTYGQIDPVAMYRIALKNIDPSKYVSDREVTDKQRDAGVMAWRKIEDPEGYGKPVYLPIFNTDILSAEERALVPKTGDDEAPELYADHGQLTYTMAVLWEELEETPAWWGQGGTGKTEFARHLAWLMRLPFRRLNITASSELDDIIGKLLLEGGETKFHYGRLPKAWSIPGVILLDEPNTGPNEIWQAVRPLTDNSKMLILDQNKGERISRGRFTYFAMAMNPAWDPRNVGTQTLGDADGSRLMHISFTLPPEDLEVEIIQQRVGRDGWQLTPKQVKALMGTAIDLRQASESQMLQTTWGLRHQIKVARALKWFPPVTAYRRAVADSLEPSQLDLILTVVGSHFDE